MPQLLFMRLKMVFYIMEKTLDTALACQHRLQIGRIHHRFLHIRLSRPPQSGPDSCVPCLTSLDQHLTIDSIPSSGEARVDLVEEFGRKCIHPDLKQSTGVDDHPNLKGERLRPKGDVIEHVTNCPGGVIGGQGIVRFGDGVQQREEFLVRFVYFLCEGLF